jgi:hypothetical protein
MNVVNDISKSDLVETKAIRTPSYSVLLVEEAICILFSKKPTHENYIKLVNGTDFINYLKNYDKDAISDYSFNELKKYIDNMSFNPTLIEKISKLSAKLCIWVHSVYEYQKLSKKVSNILK